MVMELKYGQMGLNMKVNTNMGKRMGKGFYYLLMVLDMKDHFSKMK